VVTVRAIRLVMVVASAPTQGRILVAAQPLGPRW
jgi:hypothetical protein